MNQPWIYMCSPSWTSLPPPSPSQSFWKNFRRIGIIPSLNDRIHLWSHMAPGFCFLGRFLITASISELVIGLFIIYISSWFSHGRLNYSKNLFILGYSFYCHIVVHNSLLQSFILLHCLLYNFPGSSVSKVSAYTVGDLGSIPGSGRSPGEGNSNLFQ